MLVAVVVTVLEGMDLELVTTSPSSMLPCKNYCRDRVFHIDLDSVGDLNLKSQAGPISRWMLCINPWVCITIFAAKG